MGLFCMQSLVVAMVVRQDRPIIRCGIGEHLDVATASPSGFLNRQHVVSQVPQNLHHRAGKVFVGIEPGHGRSGFIVEPDLLVDLSRIEPIVIPSNREVLGSQAIDDF